MEIWVDGDFRAIDRPALSARDRGFLYGEAVYESVKVVARRPLFLAAHLERLAASGDALGLAAGWDADELRGTLGRLLDAADLADGLARIYVTRGPAGGAPTRLAWIEPPPERSAPNTPPWRLVCHPEPIVPFLPGAKHVGRLAHALARRAAVARGADDALLVHRDGWVLEGTASNLFFFRDDLLHTPERGCGILAGITRDLVLELAPGCGFRAVEGRWPPADVAAADECFLTFTSAGLEPVAALDGATFPGGAPGPRTRRLREAYEARVADVLAGTAPC